MTKTHSLPRLVNLGRGPHAFIIAATMLDTLQHRGDARFRMVTDYSSYAAHGVGLIHTLLQQGDDVGEYCIRTVSTVSQVSR